MLFVLLLLFVACCFLCLVYYCRFCRGSLFVVRRLSLSLCVVRCLLCVACCLLFVDCFVLCVVC